MIVKDCGSCIGAVLLTFGDFASYPGLPSPRQARVGVRRLPGHISASLHVRADFIATRGPRRVPVFTVPRKAILYLQYIHKPSLRF